MTLRDDLVAALEEQIDELRERIRQLEETLGTTWEAPPIFAFTAHEAKMFGVMLKRDLVTKQQFMTALYSGRDEAEIKIVDVWIRKMRAKLKPFDIEIGTVWGQGYYLPSASKEKARAILAQFETTDFTQAAE